MTDDLPEDATTIRGMTVVTPDECAVCDKPFAFGGWHLKHGETHCGHCGVVYQIRPLSSDTWPDVPRTKVKDEYVEPMREFHDETGKNATTDADAFDRFLRENYPELAQ